MVIQGSGLSSMILVRRVASTGGANIISKPQKLDAAKNH